MAGTLAPTAPALSQEQVARYHRDGYLVVPNFASRDTCQRLRQQAAALVTQHAPAASRKSIFTTKDDQAKHVDRYFLDSANNVSIFWEEDATDATPTDRAVNKIGHAVHDLDPVFRELSRGPAVEGVLRALGFVRPMPVQSMIIFKQPKIGGEVRPHKDSTFLYTDPLSATGLWLALEPATLENGCLFTVPGSHKAGISCRFVRKEDDTVGFDQPPPALSTEGAVPLEVEAGTLVVLHGCNTHFSSDNRSPKSRHAYTVHYIEGTVGGEGPAWPRDNWLQRDASFPFEPLYDLS